MKNTIKFCVFGMILLAGILVFSCTNGVSEGTDSAGNLNIVDIPNSENGKYLSASGTIVGTTVGSNTLTFKDDERVKIKKGKVKARLYNSDGTEYTGSGTVTISAEIFDAATGGTGVSTNLGNVKFYGGSGLTNWPKELEPQI